VNGWNNGVDNNTGKTIGGTIQCKTPSLTLIENYTGGPQQNNDNASRSSGIMVPSIFTKWNVGFGSSRRAVRPRDVGQSGQDLNRRQSMPSCLTR
jgi:hypothetical protein